MILKITVSKLYKKGSRQKTPVKALIQQYSRATGFNRSILKCKYINAYGRGGIYEGFNRSILKCKCKEVKWNFEKILGLIEAY